MVLTSDQEMELIVLALNKMEREKKPDQINFDSFKQKIKVASKLQDNCKKNKTFLYLKVFKVFLLTRIGCIACTCLTLIVCIGMKNSLTSL